ncbi:hypothetical protein COOONC_01497 [Cooperia oncophora]
MLAIASCFCVSALHRKWFRDDDNGPMWTSTTTKKLIEKRLGHILRCGVYVADRWFGYLGSSNSQMRDSGAYFMEKYSRGQLKEYTERENRDPPLDWQPLIDNARKNLGRRDFHATSHYKPLRKG